MKLNKIVLSCLLLCVPFLVLMRSASAQNTNASLAGSVLDASGAALPDATITVTNTNTGTSRVAKSDTAGHYLVTNLIPGPYKVTTEKQGFQKNIQEGITLQVGQAASVNTHLSVGSLSTTISVTSSAPVVDTQTSSEGTVIGTKPVVGLPLNQRYFYSLALLAPNVEMPAQGSTLGFRGGFNVAGQEESANTFTINGIDDNDQDVMAPSFRPSIEDVQEFNMLTGVYSAEYGRTTGGQVVVITKSGGNAYHGDAFEFIRNQVTDAENYFTSAGPKPAFRRNQFGGTLGGPIAKNRAFFFFSYEGMRLAQEVAALATVPTINERNGNFTGVTTLHDPVTGAPYLNDTIPSGDISAFGQRLMSLYPLPNNNSTGANNYTFNETRTENMDEVSTRIDANPNSKNILTGQYNFFNDPSFEPSNSLCGSAVLPGFGCTTNQVSTLIGVNWTYIFSPSLLNELRVGYDRLVQPRIEEDVTNTSFPLLKNVFDDPSITNNFGAPNTSVSGFSSLAPYGNLPQGRWDNHYNLVDNVTWTHGSHTLKFGVNLLKASYSNSYVVDGRGVLSFNSSSSSSAGGRTTGNSLADMLEGYAYSSSREPSAPRLEMLYYSSGIFAQDDWKVTNNLTLNLGIRWEDFSPLRDKYNHISNFDPTTGQMIVAGGPGLSDKVYRSDLNNFGPRIGLAWQPLHNSKLVVHSAYGVYYNSPSIGNGAGLGLLSNVPLRNPQTFYTSAAEPLQIDTNPFPSPAGCSSTDLGVTPGCALTVTPTGIARDYRNMYINEYSLDVQRQLTSAMALTVAYLGSEGSRLPNEANANQPMVGNGVSAPRPYAGVYQIVYPSAHAYKYNNISFYESEGKAHYNSVMVRVKQDFSKGLYLLASYTWSKSMDNTPGYASGSQSSGGLPQDSYNPNAEWGLSAFNVAHRFLVDTVYQLPFGKDEPFLAGSRIGSMLVGGWEISGIATVETGRPFTVTNANANNSGSFNNQDRPNWIRNPNSGPKTINEWFDTTAFSTAVPKYTFGNDGRNNIIGPGYVDIDLGIQRTFPLTERVNMPIRFEAFNVANKPNFYNPRGAGQQAGTSSFGSISQANDPREMQLSVKLVF